MNRKCIKDFSDSSGFILLQKNIIYNTSMIYDDNTVDVYFKSNVVNVNVFDFFEVVQGALK